jgi:hypothetical protein
MRRTALSRYNLVMGAKLPDEALNELGTEAAAVFFSG